VSNVGTRCVKVGGIRHVKRGTRMYVSMRYFKVPRGMPRYSWNRIYQVRNRVRQGRNERYQDRKNMCVQVGKDTPVHAGQGRN
jgi:hypothetical protein